MNTSLQTGLELDEASISPDELSVPALMRELSLRDRPNWLLRLLMNALEKKRQAAGLGWSRPWNKVGLNIFRTHEQELSVDADYFAPLRGFLDRLLAKASPKGAAFVNGLLGDPACMVFTFYHNREATEGQYEGLTLSFGRKVPGDAKHRDRFDVILEDLRVDGRVDGRIDRIRCYICPWANYKQERGHELLDCSQSNGNEQLSAQRLYENCVRFYHRWKCEEARQWNHWSSDYIDYFGPRSFIPVGTSFS